MQSPFIAPVVASILRNTLVALLLAGIVLSASFAAPTRAETLASKVSRADVELVLRPWAQAIDATKRASILIDLTPGKDEALVSKVGGVPYLPAGVAVPKGAHGEELFLLAQINFSELPKSTLFPSRGILQFFIAGDEYYGASFDGKLEETNLSLQRNFRVLFHDRIDAPVAASLPSRKASTHLPFDPTVTLRMSFRTSTEVISPDDSGFEKVVGAPFYRWIEQLASANRVDEEELIDAIDSYLAPNAFAHKLGGYPSFTQEDPRPPDSPYVLLLQLASSGPGERGLMWGDAGVAGFFIRAEDLKRGKFGNILYSWDCG